MLGEAGLAGETGDVAERDHEVVVLVWIITADERGGRAVADALNRAVRMLSGV